MTSQGGTPQTSRGDRHTMMARFENDERRRDSRAKRDRGVSRGREGERHHSLWPSLPPPLPAAGTLRWYIQRGYSWLPFPFTSTDVVQAITLARPGDTHSFVLTSGLRPAGLSCNDTRAVAL
eukprot:scaffold245673_cov32-Tisochrysis_lutea.AAC.4